MLKYTSKEQSLTIATGVSLVLKNCDPVPGPSKLLAAYYGMYCIINNR